MNVYLLAMLLAVPSKNGEQTFSRGGEGGSIYIMHAMLRFNLHAHTMRRHILAILPHHRLACLPILACLAHQNESLFEKE